MTTSSYALTNVIILNNYRIIWIKISENEQFLFSG